MVLSRKIYCGVQFKPSILSELIFAGDGIGTFTKDGYVFHRFRITHVDRSTNALCGRWIGMTPCDAYIENWQPAMSFTLPRMHIEDTTSTQLEYFSLACSNAVRAPVSIKAEDEILIHQRTNPYVQIR